VFKPTVIGKKQCAAEGLSGLTDRPDQGRRPVIDEVAVVLATALKPPPERLGVPHGSSRLLGGELGIFDVWVGKMWRGGVAAVAERDDQVLHRS
jgi:hypothetical protein